MTESRKKSQRVTLPSLDFEEYIECQKMWQTHLIQFQCPIFSFFIARLTWLFLRWLSVCLQILSWHMAWLNIPPNICGFLYFAFLPTCFWEGDSFWGADMYVSRWIGEDCVCEGGTDRERFHNSEEISRCWAKTEPTAESNRQHKLLSLMWQKWMEFELLHYLIFLQLMTVKAYMVYKYCFNWSCC